MFFDQLPGQTPDQFIAAFDGTYRILVDFDGDFDTVGEEATDGVFTVTTDLSTIDASLFPATPEFTNPLNESTLPNSERHTIIEWINHAGTDADYVILDLALVDNDSEEIAYNDFDNDVTSYQTPLLPTTLGQIEAVVGAEKIFDVIGDAVHDVNFAEVQIELVEFSLASATPVFFDIDTEIAAVTSLDTTGSVGGGEDTPGRIEFEFDTVTVDGNFSAEFLSVAEYEFGSGVIP